jgi:uncharacterized RDD family membrane protein YckC
MSNTGEVQYVGFWLRVAAAIIDSILVTMVITPFLLMVYGPDYFVAPGRALHGVVDFLLQYIFPAVAIIVFWVTRSATPGKMIIGAEIVDARTLGKPSTGQFIGRYFAYYISMIPLFLGFLWVAFDKRKQGWHDKLAGTVVIRKQR